MNKVQYVKLLNLRGITELKGISIATAVKETGGNPTQKEMVEVNHQSMTHYIEKLTEQTDMNERLVKEKEGLIYQNDKLQERDDILSALEAFGVDNWCGYGEALSEMDNQN